MWPSKVGLATTMNYLHEQLTLIERSPEPTLKNLTGKTTSRYKTTFGILLTSMLSSK